MSFLKIKDPSRREQIVNDFLKTKRNIQLHSLTDKVGDIEVRREYEKIFKPITESQKEIKEEIKKMPTVPAITAAAEPPQLAIEESKPTNLGPLATHYMSKFASKKGVDKTFGIYNKDARFFIGNKPIEFDHDDIIVDGSRFKGTEGLWDLIVSKDPKEFTDDDYDDYIRLLNLTNTMKQNNDPSNTRPKSSSSSKYKQLIKPIWEAQKEINGSGLIDRFDLLMASKNAGNTGVKDEMVSILDKLLDENFINKKEHKILLSKC